MKNNIVSFVFFSSLLCGISSSAQSVKEDSLQSFAELVKIKSFYNRQPFDLTVHIERITFPGTDQKDTLQSDLRLYSDPHQFYVQSEDLEEVGNDSVLVMLNKGSKQILLYANRQKITGANIRSSFTILPDSSWSQIAKKYKARLSVIDAGTNRIEIESRQLIPEKGIPKESMKVEYHTSTHEPVSMEQIRYSLVPIDSAGFIQLEASPIYKDKVIDAVGKTGRMYFVIKEERTTFYFTKINFEIKEPPVKLNDILAKQPNGEYVVTSKYEGYSLSKEL